MATASDDCNSQAMDITLPIIIRKDEAVFSLIVALFHMGKSHAIF
jgi:hypothetical protein